MARFSQMRLLFVCLAATVPIRADAQLVPEGVHRDAEGPVELCGLTAANVTDLRDVAESSGALRLVPLASDRFELFASSDGLTQLVFTRAEEAAYPAATCRVVFQSEDGSWNATRAMRCDGSREACDKLFVEFQEVDERAAAALREAATASNGAS